MLHKKRANGGGGLTAQGGQRPSHGKTKNLSMIGAQNTTSSLIGNDKDSLRSPKREEESKSVLTQEKG
jgi:hypothetical protein